MRFNAIAIVLVAVILAGCAGSGGESPIDPKTPGTDRAAVAANRHLWGLWEVNISSDHLTAEIAPMRTVGMHLNPVRLMEVTACANCITVGNFQVYNPGEISLDVTLKHPFPGLLEYTGFDIRGTLIAGADYSFPLSGRSISYSDEKPTILNADGYTHLFNPTEFPISSPSPPILKYTPGNKAPGGDLSATLNPYLAYCEDQPRRMFETTASYTRTLRLRIPPSGPLEFGYAIDACWHPAGKPVTDPVVDFPPEANCNEAYEINLVYGNGLIPGGGSAIVQVDVYDHQGLDTIESVTLESPLLFDGEQALTFSSVTGEECFRYYGVIENELGTYESEIPVLVRVTDTVDDGNFGQIDAWTVAFLDTTPNEGWAVTWISSELGEVWGEDVATDDFGNEFVAGTIYYSPSDLDPGPGEDFHGPDQGFLSKFSSDGQYLWGRSWGGPGGGTALFSIDCDSGGNTYVSGFFVGTVDFNPGPGEDFHTATHGDSFLCKYTSSGEYVWTKVWQGEGGIEIFAVKIDPSDNLYVGGEFWGITDFNPGPGEKIIEGDIDDPYAFVSKLGSDGTFLWVGSWGHLGKAVLRDLDTDGSGNVYCTGNFVGEDIDFDPGPGEYPLSNVNYSNAYLSAFDPNGNHMWAVCWEALFGYTIAVDPLGFIYVGGGFSEIVDFDPGPEVEEREVIEFTDAYISVFNQDGKFLGVGTWDTLENENIFPFDVYSECIYDIEPDGLGNLYVATFFDELIDVAPGPGQDLRWGTGFSDALLMKIHVSGELVWAKVWGGEEGDNAVNLDRIDLDKDGNIFGTGWFAGEVDFDPGPDADYHESAIDKTIGAYLIKFSSLGSW